MTSPGGVRMASPQGRLLLVMTILGSGMAGIDSTIVNVALPVMARDLQVSPGAAIFVTNGYQLAVTAALLPLASLVLGANLTTQVIKHLVVTRDVLGPGIDNVIYAVAVFSVPVLAALVRGRVVLPSPAAWRRARRVRTVSRARRSASPAAIPRA